MTESFDHDVVIIGSGPGGYVAAIRAAQLGLKPAVIERDKPGGVCLNIGCIPSKTLIHQAEVFRAAAELEAMGVKVDRGGLDYAKVFAASRAAADTLSKGVQYLLKKNNVEWIAGEATITGPREVTVDGSKSISGKSILIAAGSRPRSIPGFEIDEQIVMSSTGLLMMQELTASLLILGSGYIGMEFAHVMNAFGVDVHVVEMLDQVLPLEDAEIAQVLERSLGKRGVEFSVSTKAVGMARTDKGVEVTLEDASGNTQTTAAEKVLVAVGRAPNTDGLGLDAVGITPEKGFIPVGDYYQTAAAGIYAVGDVIASPMLAHVASKEAEIAVEHMAGRPPRVAKVDPLAIPGAIYTEPQIASFGYNEKTASEVGIAYEKAAFPYRGAGKSVAIGRPEGMVKILFDGDTHELLGAQIVGTEATELIHELLLAKSSELLTEDITTMIHAHPTLSEAVMEAARAAEGWAIHV
jgi:dihydrolipoamide dehydrogenase